MRSSTRTLLAASSLFAGAAIVSLGGSSLWADMLVRGGGRATVIGVEDADDGPVVYVVGDGRGYLGVNIEEEVDHPEGGARVTRVVDESPAADAGIRQGDVIVRFDGRVVRGPAALTRRIHELEAGDSVRVTVLRDGAEVELEVELGRRSESWAPLPLGEGNWVLPDVRGTLGDLDIDLGDLRFELGDLGARLREGLAPLTDCDGDDCVHLYRYGMGGRPKLGVQLIETTPELRRHLGGDDDRGVLVSKVLSGTPAERAGIGVGDLILSVGGDPIENVADLRRALASRSGESFAVELVRDGRTLSVDVTLAEENDEATGPRAFRVAPFAPSLAPRVPAAAAAPRVPTAPRPAPPAPPVRPDAITSV